jgi:lipid II:glycine glycyltransferase (peptidoglycan interpeptide bridge formation enzyme)
MFVTRIVACMLKNTSFCRLESPSPVKRLTDLDERNRPPQQQQQQQQQQQLQYNQELQSLREDLREKSNRLEAALADKNQLTRKLKSLELRDTTDHSKKVKLIYSAGALFISCQDMINACEYPTRHNYSNRYFGAIYSMIF